VLKFDQSATETIKADDLENFLRFHRATKGHGRGAHGWGKILWLRYVRGGGLGKGRGGGGPDLFCVINGARETGQRKRNSSLE